MGDFSEYPASIISTAISSTFFLSGNTLAFLSFSGIIEGVTHVASDGGMYGRHSEFFWIVDPLTKII